VQFVLMRFLMLPRAGQAPPIIREAWLRGIFSKEIVFNSRGVEFHYVPVDPLEEYPEFIVGRLGRRIIAAENEPPESKFAETEHEGWRAALVLIDPRSHDDGQKAAVEHLPEVGRPLGIVGSLCEGINTRVRSEPYYIEANAIADTVTFWDFEKEHRDNIVDIIFTLHVPNMFGIRDDLDKELQELRDNEKVRLAKIELKNEDGLNLNTDRVSNTVSHTLDGGGALTARTKDGQRYNSRHLITRKTIEVELPSDAEPPSFVERVRRAILGVFGS
jgi:hypothetical protein